MLASVVTPTAHQRWCRPGKRSPARCAASAGDSRGDPWSSGSATSVRCCVSVIAAISVEGLTVRVAFLAALAVSALLLTGWRKPARVGSTSPRGTDRDDRRIARGIEVEHLETDLHRSPGPIRRLAAAIGAGTIAIVTGMVLAILLSFAAAIAVIRLTDLLTS